MSHKIYMLRGDEWLANLGAVYMKGDILARQYKSVKWYCFSEYESKISPGISKQKVLPPIKFFYIMSFALVSKWIILGIVYCFCHEQLTIHHCRHMVNSHKKTEKS